MEKLITLSPAWNKTDPNSKKNYGIHGVELRMVLKGLLGAVQFVLFTNWYLPEDQIKQRKYMSPDKYYLYEPMPADKGYHSPKKRYEGQTICQKKCEYLDGKPCYYDGSGLNAEPLYDILLKEGSEGVWKNLEQFYIDIFNELK